MKVIEIDPQTDPRWEQFVESHPRGSVYHHPAWLSSLKQEYNQRSAHLACEGPGGELLAILPLFYTRGLPFNLGGTAGRRRLSSLPRTPLGGPLSKSPEATAAILRAAVDKVRQTPGVQLQIKTDGPELDGLADGLVGSPWRQSYVLNLHQHSTEGQFRINNKSHRDKVKNATNKAAKLGVHARLSESEAELRQWYPLYVDSLQRNGVPARPYRLFANLWEGLRSRGMLQFWVAEQEDAGKKRLVAGSIFLIYGRTVFYAFTGSSRRDLSLHPYDAILWAAINEACKAGFEFVDFGEVVEGDTELARFKTKWGCDPVQLHRYYHPPLSVQEDNSPESRNYLGEIRDATWRHLPLRAVEWLGDRIYSFL